MDRKHLPKLGDGQKWEDGIVGWFFVKGKDGREVIFQCPNGHRAGLKLHSISPSGEVNASVLCYENDYHEMCILDDWDSKYFKEAGKETVEESHDQE